MRIPKAWAVGGGTYVGVVTVLAGVATADPNDFVTWAWAGALVLSLPSLIVALPLIYVLVPLSWQIQATTVPTTVAYMICFAFAATLNTGLAWILTRAWQLRLSRQRRPVG